MFLLQVYSNYSVSWSVVSDPGNPTGLQPARLLRSWDSSGKNTGVVSHSLLQGLFLTHGSNAGLPHCFPGGSEIKASACNVGDLGSIPGLGRSPGGGNGNPLQYSCLENPMDGGTWWATVHGVAKSRIQLNDFTSSSSHNAGRFLTI